MANSDQRPVQDLGVPKPGVPYRAGGRDQGTLTGRKNALMDTGTLGYVPGHDGTGPGSSARGGSVYEDQPYGRVVGTPDLYHARRPMPREVPMQQEYTRAGRLVRFLDGRSEVMRDRPGMLADMKDPDLHPEDRADLRDAISQRDHFPGHVYW